MPLLPVRALAERRQRAARARARAAVGAVLLLCLPRRLEPAAGRPGPLRRAGPVGPNFTSCPQCGDRLVAGRGSAPTTAGGGGNNYRRRGDCRQR